jgi:pimeloyl-ACP methyl ester carboxylesterase
VDLPRGLTQVEIDGTTVELTRQGEGRPLLYLHSVEGPNPAAPWLLGLAHHFEVIAPWHPGFGLAPRPAHLRTIGDLALYYLEFVAQLGLSDAVLVGASFGGWLAAEIAVRDSSAFSHTVFIDPLGIKIGDRERRDIADVFAMSQEELTGLAYHDTRKRARDYSTMTDAERLMIARGRESYAYFGWQPYMHNPSLRHWLRRVRVPGLVLWGESDGLVSREYGAAFANALAQGQFRPVPAAGHYPLVEQPEATVRAIIEFVVGEQDREASELVGTGGR